MDYHSFGAASDAHLLLLRDEVADVGGRRRCHHHMPGTVPHRRRVRAHAGGYTLSGSPGATENVKCSRRHARSSGLGPIEGKDRCLRVPVRAGTFLSPEPRFYPLGQIYAFGRVRASSLQIRAFEDSAARRSHSRRFLGSRTRTFAFFLRDGLELPDLTRLGHNTRERPIRTSSHPLASPGHTPGDRTEGPQDPRTRTKLLRAPRYLEI